jgi:hypothetical protein
LVHGKPGESRMTWLPMNVAATELQLHLSFSPAVM